MNADNSAVENAAQPDDLTYEPVARREVDPAIGLIAESLRRREPTLIIR